MIDKNKIPEWITKSNARGLKSARDGYSSFIESGILTTLHEDRMLEVQLSFDTALEFLQLWNSVLMLQLQEVPIRSNICQLLMLILATEDGKPRELCSKVEEEILEGVNARLDFSLNLLPNNETKEACMARCKKFLHLAMLEETAHACYTLGAYEEAKDIMEEAMQEHVLAGDKEVIAALQPYYDKIMNRQEIEWPGAIKDRLPAIR